MTVMVKSVPTAQRVTTRMRGLLTALNFHFAGVALLAVVNLYLGLHMVYLWQAAKGQNPEAVAQQTVQMKTAEIAAKPLAGLDEKLTQATADADKFYARRLPYAYSQVAGEIGALAKRDGVKLTRVQYGQSPVMDGTAGALTEVRMDASLSGDYRGLVQFINAVERDKMFFVISGVTLTGQQSGTVGLRVRLATYLRAPVGNEVRGSLGETTGGAE